MLTASIVVSENALIKYILGTGLLILVTAHPKTKPYRLSRLLSFLFFCLFFVSFFCLLSLYIWRNIAISTNPLEMRQNSYLQTWYMKTYLTWYILPTIKGGLISYFFFHFELNWKKECHMPNHYSEHYPHKEKMLRVGILHLSLWDLSEVKNFLSLSHL